MEILHTHCAGLDVHKKTVVACAITPKAKRGWQRETKTFGTMTADLLALSDWLQAHGITHVAMESTGEYWRPVFNILEGSFDVMVVNAQHIKAVPGRKTDVKDAECRSVSGDAELLQHGLLRGSFIPPESQRDLRDLTRHRSNPSTPLRTGICARAGNPDQPCAQNFGRREYQTGVGRIRWDGRFGTRHLGGVVGRTD